MLPLRVASYNVRCGDAPDGLDGWTYRRPKTAQMLRELDFDLAGLQEPIAGQLDDLLGALPGYRSLGVGRDDGDREGEFAAIVFRESRLRPLNSGTFWFSDTPDLPGSATWGNRCVRICTWAIFEDAATGESFSHYNVHLDHESQYSRERSAELLLRRTKEGPVPIIVTGDFNAGEENPSLRLLADGGLTDTYRVVHPDATEVGTFCGFTDRFERDKIDYILASPGVEVLESKIVRRKIEDRWPSDHAALLSVLRIPPEP